MAKIILLGSYAPSLINFRGPLLKALVRQGHKVIACAPEITENLCQQLDEIGVSSRSFPLSRTGLNPVKDIKTIVALKNLFLQEQPDAVLSYTIKPVIYGSIAARCAGVVNVCSMITGLGYTFIGNSLKQRVLGMVTRFLYKFSLVYSRRVFFQNPDDRDLFIQLGLVSGDHQLAIIDGSGVDLDYYQYGALPSDISFLLIARLIKEKGVQEYVDAAGIIRGKYPGIKFTIVGWVDSSPSAISVEDLEKWQQVGLIDFKGKLEDVRPAISNTSVYVLPSYREGTPRTVLEAMAMGRPIITTDTPGCRETVIDGENGYLVPPQNPIALAEAMEKYILQPDLICKMGMESRNIVKERYDVHKVNKVILREMNLCKVSEHNYSDDHATENF